MSELPLLAFDINETLLDIEALAPQFQRIYESKSTPGAEAND
jgi:hypothetical protein